MFDLKQFVHDMMGTTEECDPVELAYLVFGKMSSEDHAEALLQALPTYISQTQVKDRGRSVPAPAAPEPIPAATPKKKARVAQGPSHWEQKITANYNPKLHRVYVGANGVRKKMGDFTSEDFRAMVAAYKERINNEMRFVERCEEVADYMETNHVATAWDVPEEVTGKL